MRSFHNAGLGCGWWLAVARSARPGRRPLPTATSRRGCGARRRSLTCEGEPAAPDGTVEVNEPRGGGVGCSVMVGPPGDHATGSPGTAQARGPAPEPPGDPKAYLLSSPTPRGAPTRAASGVGGGLPARRRVRMASARATARCLRGRFCSPRRQPHSAPTSRQRDGAGLQVDPGGRCFARQRWEGGFSRWLSLFDQGL